MQIQHRNYSGLLGRAAFQKEPAMWQALRFGPQLHTSVALLAAAAKLPNMPNRPLATVTVHSSDSLYKAYMLAQLLCKPPAGCGLRFRGWYVLLL